MLAQAMQNDLYSVQMMLDPAHLPSDVEGDDRRRCFQA